MRKFLLFALPLLGLAACEKELGNESIDVLPSSSVFTVRYDTAAPTSVVTLLDKEIHNTIQKIGSGIDSLKYSLLLGQMDDDVLGHTTAGLHTMFNLNSTDLDLSNFGGGFTAEFRMVVDASFGQDTSTVLDISAFRSKPVASRDEFLSIRNNAESMIAGPAIGSVSGQRIKKGSIIRIPIEPAEMFNIIEALKDAIGSIDEAETRTLRQRDSIFHTKIPGYIFTTSKGKRIARMNSFVLRINYKKQDDKTSFYDLNLYSNEIDKNLVYCPPKNYFTHQHNAQVASVLNKTDQQVAYIQPGAGLKTRIGLDVQRWRDSVKNGMAINRAMIYITLSDDQISGNLAGNSAAIDIFADGNRLCTLKAQMDKASKRYACNATEFIQYLSSTDSRSKAEYLADIVPFNSHSDMGRAIIHKPKEAIEIVVTYTK